MKQLIQLLWIMVILKIYLITLDETGIFTIFPNTLYWQTPCNILLWMEWVIYGLGFYFAKDHATQKHFTWLLVSFMLLPFYCVGMRLIISHVKNP